MVTYDPKYDRMLQRLRREFGDTYTVVPVVAEFYLGDLGVLGYTVIQGDYHCTISALVLQRIVPELFDTLLQDARRAIEQQKPEPKLSRAQIRAALHGLARYYNFDAGTFAFTRNEQLLEDIITFIQDQAHLSRKKELL